MTTRAAPGSPRKTWSGWESTRKVADLPADRLDFTWVREIGFYDEVGGPGCRQRITVAAVNAAGEAMSSVTFPTTGG